jgi:hypothetical protein
MNLRKGVHKGFGNMPAQKKTEALRISMKNMGTSSLNTGDNRKVRKPGAQITNRSVWLIISIIITIMLSKMIINVSFQDGVKLCRT